MDSFDQEDFIRLFKKSVKDKNTRGKILYAGWEGEFERNVCHYLYHIHLRKGTNTLSIDYDSRIRAVWEFQGLRLNF